MISHEIVYRERTIVFHSAPAHVCPECGEAVLAEETISQLYLLLPRKARSNKDAFAYEA
jgi:YgiT-type zinc finger domain-containing protein